MKRKGFTLIELIVMLGIVLMLCCLLFQAIGLTGFFDKQQDIKGFVQDKQSFLGEYGREYFVVIRVHPGDAKEQYKIEKKVYDQLTVEGAYDITIKGDYVIAVKPPTAQQ